MSRRNNPERCAACRMHDTLCICGIDLHGSGGVSDRYLAGVTWEF